MTIRFTCPRCRARLTVADNLAGRWGVCAKCGSRCIAQESTGPREPARSEGAGKVPTPSKPQQTVPQSTSSASRRLRQYALVAAIAAGVVVVALCLWAVLLRDTWEQDNRDKILSMCNEATALAKMGELTRFDAKRAAILALVGTRRVENHDLKAALQRLEDAGNILFASAKREAERVGQAEAARLEGETKRAIEEEQRKKAEAERLAVEEKKRRDDAETQRRAEEEKQRLAAEARQNAEKERERLVAEANRRAEEEKQKKAEAQRQAEEQRGREAEAKQQADEEQRKQEAIAALSRELGRITASLEQAKAEGRAAVQERNQLQYKYNSERQQVEQEYQTMVNDIEKKYKSERRSLSPPIPPPPFFDTPAERVEYQRQYAEYQRQLAEVERRRSERLLAAEAWRTNQYREIDRRYQPQVTAIDSKIAQLAEVVKSLMQSQADLQNRLKKMK